MPRNDENRSEADESDDNQYQLTDYQHVRSDGPGWKCQVCGFTSSDKATVENCHPDTRLNRERDTAVTGTESGHVGFTLPEPLNPAVRTLLEEVRAAVRQADADDVLLAATNVLARHLPEPESTTRAFQLYTHLVWLQQYQELPGYPLRTDSDDTISLRAFLNSTTEVEGEVTNAQIDDSELLEQHKISRANVRSVEASSLFETSPVTDIVTEDDQQTLPDTGWDVFQFKESTPFFEGTAHNTIVRELRNWLVTHPDIDWATAPHVTGVPPSHESSESTAPNDDTGTHPGYMFDFAGFTEQPRPEVAVIGCVFGSEEYEDLVTKLTHIGETKATAVVAVRSRKAIHHVIATLDAKGLLETPPAPTEDVFDYYETKPSIQGVNEEFAERVPELDHVRFITGRQLSDDIVTPGDVLPDQIAEQDAGRR